MRKILVVNVGHVREREDVFFGDLEFGVEARDEERMYAASGGVSTRCASEPPSS